MCKAVCWSDITRNWICMISYWMLNVSAKAICGFSNYQLCVKRLRSLCGSVDGAVLIDTFVLGKWKSPLFQWCWSFLVFAVVLYFTDCPVAVIWQVAVSQAQLSSAPLLQDVLLNPCALSDPRTVCPGHLCEVRMENSGYSESFPDLHTATSSDEDLVEITGATLDFSSTDDVPPLDKDYGSGRCLNGPNIRKL